MAEFREYLADYDYNGERWSLSVMAESHQDARRRLQFAGANAEVVGYVKEALPVGAHLRRLKPFFFGSAAFWLLDLTFKSAQHGLWLVAAAFAALALVVTWSGIIASEQQA